MLCFHETPVLRFALLPYYRRVGLNLKNISGNSVIVMIAIIFTIIIITFPQFAQYLRQPRVLAKCSGTSLLCRII